MPEEVNPPEQSKEESTTEVIDLDKKTQKPKLIAISRGKFIGFIALFLVVLLVVGYGSYSFGVQSEKNSKSGQIEKKETKKTETNEPGVETVDINEEVTVKSGITVKLEEAKYDAAYEKQKNESKEYYEKNSSQSAYLESDYFKNSQLNLKVSLENLTKKAVSYSPSSFRLKDSDDVQYVANYEGDKQVYGLNPDEKTKISLSYNVPTSEKKFRLIYENAVIEFSIK